MSQCTFARVVLHYWDGTEAIEEREIDGHDGKWWHNIRKDGIQWIGIQFDPLPLPGIVGMTVDGRKGPVTAVLPPTRLYNAMALKNQFYQMKDHIIVVARKGGARTIALIVGVMLNKAGDCMVMEGREGGEIFSFVTNVHKLQQGELSLELMQIEVENLDTDVPIRIEEHPIAVLNQA